jgi:hypothetical protein
MEEYLDAVDRFHLSYTYVNLRYATCHVCARGGVRYLGHTVYVRHIYYIIYIYYPLVIHVHVFVKRNPCKGMSNWKSPPKITNSKVLK